MTDTPASAPVSGAKRIELTLRALVLGCLLAVFIGDIVSFIETFIGVYLFDPSVYLISALPSRLLASDVALVVLSAAAISFLATLYPAWRAGQVLPAEALRYDR